MASAQIQNAIRYCKTFGAAMLAIVVSTAGCDMNEPSDAEQGRTARVECNLSDPECADLPEGALAIEVLASMDIDPEITDVLLLMGGGDDDVWPPAEYDPGLESRDDAEPSESAASDSIPHSGSLATQPDVVELRSYCEQNGWCCAYGDGAPGTYYTCCCSQTAYTCYCN